MIKLNRSAVVALYGAIWLAAGVSLLTLGIRLLGGYIEQVEGFPHFMPLLDKIGIALGGEDMAVIALVAIGLFIGYLKAKHVLSKAVNRAVSRIISMPCPIALRHVFDRKYLILIAAMMGLGFSMRFFNVPHDIRGLIDVAVGSALITGGVSYFRNALSLYTGAT